MASTSPLMMVFSQDRISNTTGSKVHEGSSNNNNNQDASKVSSEQPASKLPRGRKPGKSSKSSAPPMNKNKPTRRGMGVAKLERWLEAEKLGGDHHHHHSPAEVVADGFPLHPHNQFHQTPLIPVAASPSVYVGSDLLMSRSSSSSSSFMATSSSKVISTLGCGSGAKELSSIPKVMNQYHHCDASCYSKNKCMNMEEMQGMILGGVNNTQEKLVFSSSLINCHMLPGLNHGHNNIVGLLETNDFNSRVIRRICNQGSEVIGISTRSSQVSSSSCSTLKEYEFFPPGKGLKEYELFPGSTTSGRSYARSSSEQQQPNHYCYTEPAASSSSYFIPSSDFSQYNIATASATNSNVLDLSLKL